MFAEDLTAFFDTVDGFADEAVIGGAAIKGIFDREFIQTDRIEGYAPIFTCRTDDITEAGHNDTITILDVAYTIQGNEPDGTGITKLLLQKT